MLCSVNSRRSQRGKRCHMERERVDRLVTVKEVARHLHVPESWVYSKSERREIPCIRVGRYVRFDLDAVLASFAEARTDGR